MLESENITCLRYSNPPGTASSDNFLRIAIPNSYINVVPGVIIFVSKQLPILPLPINFSFSIFVPYVDRIARARLLFTIL